MDGCVACELTDGRRPLPGGQIAQTERWVVEHCVGPLGLATLILKPKRHVTEVSGLTAAEASELGPLLRRASWVAEQLVEALVPILDVVTTGSSTPAIALYRGAAAGARSGASA
jgi:diadenosine tetraphosphate (Ap4A) HIT family hydrolase